MDDVWESAEFARILNEYDSSKNVQDGMTWIAATIAHKMRHLNLNLGTNIDDENLKIPSSQFNEYVSEYTIHMTHDSLLTHDLL